MPVRHQFVDHHAGSQQIAYDATLLPRNADHEGDGSEDHAEDLLQARREPVSDVVVNAAKNTVHQGDQRQERNQHGGDVQGQVQAVDGSAGDGAEHIFVLGDRVGIDVGD